MNPQFKKGVLELCVLATVSSRDCYAYDLVASISEHIQVTEGTIYPLLRRMTAEGHFLTHIQESQGGGPPRKYYRLSPKGKKYLAQLVKDWEEFQIGVQAVIAPVAKNLRSRRGVSKKTARSR